MKVTAHRSTTGYQIDLGDGAYMDFHKTAGTETVFQPRVAGFQIGMGLTAKQVEELGDALKGIAIDMALHQARPEIRKCAMPTIDELALEYGGC